MVSSAKRDGQELIAVTLNAPNDWSDHAALFDYGFSSYPRTLAVEGKQSWLSPAAEASGALLLQGQARIFFIRWRKGSGCRWKSPCLSGRRRRYAQAKRLAN